MVAAVPKVLAAVVLAIAWASTAQAQVRVSMTADRTSLTLDEQVVVRIEVESEGGGSADIQVPSFTGFEVVSQQVQRPMQFSFSFGNRAVVRSSTNYTFGLRPVSIGRLTIDAVRVSLDGKVFASRPIEISVSDRGGAAPGAQPQASPGAQGASADAAEIDDTAFLRTVVDKPEPYVGEQVTVTVYLYLRQQLRAAPGVQREPGTEGFWTRDLLPPNHQLQGQRQVVRGAVFAVYVLRRFAAFPLRSGELAIGPMSLRIDQSSLFDMFAPGGQAALERTGVAVPIHVRPLPDTGKPAGEITVGRFELSASLDRGQVVTGDAVTLKATVRGQGNLGDLRLRTPTIDGVEVLQPEIKDLVEAPEDVVGGTREYTWLLVPKTPGEHTVPPLVLNTFDPTSDRYVTRTTPALPLLAAGQAIAAPTAAVAAPEAPAVHDGAATTLVEWPPIRPASALRRKQPRTLVAGVVPWLYALPPMAWLSLLSVAWARKRSLARAARPHEIALRAAQQHLANAAAAAQRGDARAFHSEAAAAVTSALSARARTEVSGFTRPELRAHLARRGASDDLVSAVTTHLDRCDFARFGSVGAAELADDNSRLRSLFERIEALELRTEEAA